MIGLWPKCLQNLEVTGYMVNDIKKLHLEDGALISWCYFMKWLPDHIHMHTKFELNRTNGSWDTKQREIWTLTFICIAKIASYQLDVIMWYDCLVTLHMHKKSGLNRSSSCRDTKQRECVRGRMCVCVCDIRRWKRFNYTAYLVTININVWYLAL